MKKILNVNKNIIWGGADQAIRLIFFSVLLLYYSYITNPEKVGVVSLLLVVLQVLNALSRLTLDSFLIKSIINFKNYSIIDFFLKFRIITQFTCSLILILIFFNFKFINISSNLFVSIIILNFFRIHEIFEGYFKSYNNFRLIFLSRVFSYSIVTIFIIFCSKLDYIEIIFVLDALFMLVFVGLSFKIFSKEQSKFKINWNRFKPFFKRDFSKGFILTISFLLYLILSKMDWFSIMYFMDNSNLGIYSFYSKFVEPFTALTSVLAVSYYPDLISVYKKSKDEFNNRFYNILKNITRIGWFFYLIILVVFFLILSTLISKFYSDFLSGKIIFYLLSINIVLYFNSCLRSYYLIIVGKSDEILKFTIITIFIFFPISLVLVYFFGLVGGAISSILYNIFYQLLVNRFSKKIRDYSQMQLKSLFLIRK